MKKIIANVLTLVFVVGSFLMISSCSGKKDNLPDFVKNEMKLVWSDEFDGESNEPNPENWNYKEGGFGWGNNELQNYTKDRENSYVSDGTLKIVAKKNDSGKWTSARLVTQYKQQFTYGYFEFRAKVPTEKGCWPALWMLPELNEYGTWPRSGEIDVMEASRNIWGDDVYGTLHCLAGYGSKPIISVPKEIKSMKSRWHTYAINWTADSITWYYDGEVLSEYKNPKKGEDNWKEWPFDQKFHILMNVAMGGNLGGDIDKKVEECVMEVDYIRYYQ